MFNILSDLSFYKSHSILIIEPSIGVNYGKATPFVKFKFAPRDDKDAPGQWDEENTFWFTSYVEIYNFVNDMKSLLTNKIDKIECKNPKKKTMIMITKTKNDKTQIEYINFMFFRGEVKIKVSLEMVKDFQALYSYFSNLVTNYIVTCQIALMKYDVWYGFGNGKKEAGMTSVNNSNTKNYKSKTTSNYNQKNNTTSSFDEDNSNSNSNSNSDFDYGSSMPFESNDNEIPF